MSGKVHALKLSGLDGVEAARAVRSLLDDRSVPDLSDLIVIDDTAILLEHTTAFERLLTSGRLNYLICVVIGPPAHGDRFVTLPGSISSGQGSVVLWVSDPIGVDWPLESSAVATSRPYTTLSGIHHLIEVLATVEVFNQVRELVLTLPGGVASPGLRLDEASEMTSGFPFALAASIRRFTEPQATIGRPDGVDSPMSQLDEQLGGSAQLDANGRLAQARDRCEAEAEAASTALDEMAEFRGLFGTGMVASHARDQISATGEALKEFKDMVAELLDYAHAPAGLNERQRRRLQDAGLRLTTRTAAEPPEPRPGGSSGSALPSDAVTKAVVAAVRAGDQLPSVIERLAAVGRKRSPRGSRTFLADVEQCCPAPLPRRLLDPSPLPPPQPWLPLAGMAASALGALGRTAGIVAGVIIVLAWTSLVALSVGSRSGSSLSKSRSMLVVNFLAALAGAAVGAAIGFLAHLSTLVTAIGIALAVLIAALAAARSWHHRVLAWKHVLRPYQAADAANALADLVVRVGASEWSADTATLEAIIRTKITAEGIRDRLREYATDVETSGGDARSWEQARLSGGFESTLRDLASSVIASQPARGHIDGQTAYRHVKAKTDDLLSQWTKTAQERGPFARPPFATGSDRDDIHIDQGDLGAIAMAATHDPDDVMWQLCAPADLPMLDTRGRKGVVAFAPRMMRQELHRQLPSDTVWTSSGQYAGLLRLVPLRPGRVIVDWSDSSEQELAND